MANKSFTMEDRRQKMSGKYGKDFPKIDKYLKNMHQSIWGNIAESVECVAFLNNAFKTCQGGAFENLIMTASADLIMQSVIKANIMALSRAWDTDFDTPSIPNAAALLVIPGYEAYGRTDAPEEALRITKMQREDIYRKVMEVSEGDLFKRFKLHRNNYLAHSLPHKSRTDLDLFIDEDTELCKISLEVEDLISVEMRTGTRSLLEEHKKAKINANAFWSCLSSGQRT